MEQQFNSKVLLFGEYAVLHNGMALVIPCDKFGGHFEFSNSAEQNPVALQSNEYLRKFCAFISSRMDEEFVIEVKRFEKELNEGLFFSSNIPQGYGLGSSGALVAAMVLRYLVKAKYVKDDIKLKTYHRLQDLKKKLGDLESYFHGASSGLDPLSIMLNEPILYKSSTEIQTTKLPKPSDRKENVIFLLDTNAPRTTSKMMKIFNKLNKTTDFHDHFEKYVRDDSNKAIEHLIADEKEDFYRSIHNVSQFQLDYMHDFFPEKLQKEVAKGLDNGDYFLKICGAGGGGFMLGFTQNWEKTQTDLKDYKLEEIYAY